MYIYDIIRLRVKISININFKQRRLPAVKPLLHFVGFKNG